MDPDPNGLYVHQAKTATHWNRMVMLTNRLSSIPLMDGERLLKRCLCILARAEMNEHIARSGKSVSNIQHHSVPTSLRKAKTFLEDEYLRETTASSDDRCFYFQAKCCHGFRKNESPYQSKLALCIFKGDVLDSSCTHVAGKAGFCNHISALMFKICKYTLFEAKTTKDLCQEKDENPELACSSQLQRWHKKGGGKNIVPQTAMEVYVTKTKLDDRCSSKGSGGVKCLFYEARKQPHYDPRNEASFKTEIATIDPNMGFAHLSKSNNSSCETAQKKYGGTPVGSFLSYQVLFSESNFSAEADLNAVPRNNVLSDNITAYPRFPLANENPMVTPRELSSEEAALLSHLSVDEDKVNTIEASTREQSESEIWKKKRTYRFTASRFQLIAKLQRNHKSFAQSIMHPRPFTSKYVAQEMKYESVALREYEKFMFNRKTPVAVLKSGFVVSEAFPALGASPDAKVIDFECSICFGLAEVKCPHIYQVPRDPQISSWRR